MLLENQYLKINDVNLICKIYSNWVTEYCFTTTQFKTTYWLCLQMYSNYKVFSLFSSKSSR